VSAPATDATATERGQEQPDDEFNEPVPDVKAAQRGFRLYYRERVERVIVAYNRFVLFGDVTFGTTIGRTGISRTGSEYEVVPGPGDNNQIGTSVWTTWHAYKVYRSRILALSLIRMFEGLVFFEAISGHPGLTARMVYPGWTLAVDGAAGTVLRTRKGVPIEPPVAPDPALEEEILSVFFDGFRAVYRENPEDFLLSYMPAAVVERYAVTYSFSMLPHYLRVSDCCTSLMRTPAPFPWQGAFWGNHNSRDNFPDLALGFLAAREAMADETADADLRAAAERAWAAGQRIGDLIQSHDGRLMTIDEHHPYGTLVVAGALRPDGETESEDLGSLSDCQMVFLARALSSHGLGLPLPELPAPGSLEYLLAELLGEDAGCPVPEPVRMCTRLEEAYCGKDWKNIEQLRFMGTPWLELVKQLDEAAPGTGEELIGSFQDDYEEKTTAMVGLVYYAGIVGDQALLAEARDALGGMTQLMRTYADIIYARTDPDRLVEQVYEAALFDAQGGLEVNEEELNDFSLADGQMSSLEDMLKLAETETAPLLTDEEIRERVEERLAGASDTVKQRYQDAYGDTPPVRRSGDGYEARGYHPDHEWPWQEVETPKHILLGGVRLFKALPLCLTAPELLDCTWARLGCARPDLDGSGVVDHADQALFDNAAQTYQGVACGSGNQWCEGADLDRTGIVDEVDHAFMDTAQGCTVSFNYSR